MAERENGSLRWLLGDHLGSTAYTINGATKTGEVRYLPFGANRYTSGQTLTSFKFTGQREEAGLGLYFYGARWYDPALGRFIQADTIVPNPGDAQGFDRYAYVNNNPLKYQDPSGHSQTYTDYGGGGGPIVTPDMLIEALRYTLGALGGGYAAIQMVDTLTTDKQDSAPPAPAPPSSTVLADPLPAQEKPQVIGVPLDQQPLPVIYATQPIVQTQQILADPLPEQNKPVIYTYTSQLDRNMQTAGIVRPADSAAHHIVAANDPRGVTARGILTGAGIGIDDPVNGVYLPANQNIPNLTGADVHSTLHTDRYYNEVQLRLTRRGNQSVQSVLQQIRQELQAGTFPH